MGLRFVFDHIQVWSEALQDSAYSIPQNGHISVSEKWQGRHDVNNPASYLQTAQALKIIL
jgi:hypothetical protein